MPDFAKREMEVQQRNARIKREAEEKAAKLATARDRLVEDINKYLETKGVRSVELRVEKDTVTLVCGDEGIQISVLENARYKLKDVSGATQPKQNFSRAFNEEQLMDWIIAWVGSKK